MTLDVIGWIAVVLTQVFYIPNTVRILRTRDVRGYSLLGWLLLFSGLVCFLVYFTAQGDAVGIVANVCGVTGSGSTAFCIWLWRGREPATSGFPAAAEAAGRIP